jgi:outer membrane protein TolC
MDQQGKYTHMLRLGYWQRFVVLAGWLVFSFTGVVAAQNLSPATSRDLSLPTATGLPLTALIAGVKANNAMPPASNSGGQAYNGGPSSTPNQGDVPAGVRRITLEEAQEQATGASNPLVRLGELQVEAAKQHRLGVQAMYFPNISGQVLNNHFNKQPGEVLALQRPIVGGFLDVPVNIISKNGTFLNFAAVQPVTPLFAIYQLVKIARADENIARAKAGMPVTEAARKVEKNYFDLLVAQRELTSAEADAKKIQPKWLTASSGAPRVSTEEETDMIGAEKAVVLAASKVKELTASLDEMIGLPEETRLELVPPEPLVEDVSLQEATDKAAANPDVVEAEQTAIKAHAGLVLAKAEYFPVAAIFGGATNQNLVNVVLPGEYTYLGFVATYTVFDFGKREHGVKERKAQSEAADLGVQLTKAKAAGLVKSSYIELERSRKLSQLARRMVAASRVVEASYQPDNPEVESARATMEADMFRAELEYRQAYATLKSLMGEK